MSDLEAVIKQSVVDKIVSSQNYPLTVFEHRKPYEGKNIDLNSLNTHDAIDIPTEDFFKNIDEGMKLTYKQNKFYDNTNEELEKSFFKNLSDLKENFESCRKAHQEFDEYISSNPGSNLSWDGPDLSELDNLIDSIDDYEKDLKSYKNLKSLIEFKALVTKVKIKVSKPSFEINGTRFNLNSLVVFPSGTGEVWAKYKWLKCIRRTRVGGICYRWRWTTRNTRILKVSLTMKVNVKAHANVIINKTILNIYGKFDELRLDHRFLRLIPLEKLANKYVSKKPLAIFDAGVFVKTLPVLNKKFKISSIEVPETTKQIIAKIEIEEV